MKIYGLAWSFKKTAMQRLFEIIFAGVSVIQLKLSVQLK